MPVADIHRILQQAFAVSADIQHDRDYARRIDPSGRGIDGQLADRDLDSTYAPMAQSQNLFGVSSQDQVDVFWPCTPVLNASSIPSGWSMDR